MHSWDPLPYVPMMRGKASEFNALGHLPDEVKRDVYPFIWADVGLLRKEMDKKKSLGRADIAISSFAAKLLDCWGGSGPVMVDFRMIPFDEFKVGKEHPLGFFGKWCATWDVECVPVISTESDDEYIKAALNICNNNGHRAAIRISREEVLAPALIGQQISEMLSSIGSKACDVDFVIDLGSIDDADMESLNPALIRSIKKLVNFPEWRSLAVVAGSFPINLSSVDIGRVSKIERKEILVRRAILRDKSLSKRGISFGDYGVQHPDPGDVGFRRLSTYATIRYAELNHWLVAKEKRLGKKGTGYFGACRDIVSSIKDENRGFFCFGDQQIVDKANGKNFAESASHWRAVEINRHISITARFVAKPIALSDVA